MSDEAPFLDPEKLAEEKGCYVFYPDKNQLTIDIDTLDQYGIFLQRFNELEDLFLVTGFDELPSRSGLPHRHILITCSEPIPEAKKIALQFALGSDPIRETMNLWRHLKGEERPCRFFQPKPSVAAQPVYLPSFRIMCQLEKNKGV